jgi:hypothetical protein
LFKFSIGSFNLLIYSNDVVSKLGKVIIHVVWFGIQVSTIFNAKKVVLVGDQH